MKLSRILFFSLGLFLVQTTDLFAFFDSSVGSIYGVQNAPADIVVADFDNDGDEDLATVNGNGSFSSLINTNGIFNTGNSINFPSYSNSKGIKNADFDNDGDQDLLIGHIANTQINVLDNNGDGDFVISQSLTAGFSNSVDIGDLDNDGDNDAVAVGTIDGFTKVINILTNTNGTLSRTSRISISDSPKEIMSKDFDNDGDLDLLTMSKDIVVYSNDGTGAFIKHSSLLNIGTSPFDVVATDIDNDEDLDLAVAELTYKTIILQNNGNGNFTVQSTLTHNTGGQLSIVAADLDNDGDQDLITGGQKKPGETMSYLVFLLNSNGTFTTNNTKNILTYPGKLAVSDFNLDGLVDLAIADGIKAEVNILLQTDNTPPVFDEISNQSISENQNLSFSISANDADDDELTYDVSGLPDGAIFNSQTQTFSWTPNYDNAGVYEVIFSVSDGQFMDSASIEIEVININRKPVFNDLETLTVNEENLLSFVVFATDPDNDPLTYSASGLPSGASFDPETQTFNWTPGYDNAGTYEVIFSVSDGELSDTATATIEVLNTNRAPILEFIGNQSTAENLTLSFIISASDPDNDLLTYTAANLPSGASFDPQTQTFTWTPGYSDAGNYENIEFSVMDNGSPMEVDVELITITVGNVNRAPILLSPGAQEVLEEDTLEFAITAEDPDNDSFVLAATDLPSGASFDPQTGAFSWTPSLSQEGIYTLSFTATDTGSPAETGTTNVVITVGDNPTPIEQSEDIIEDVIDLDLPANVENSYMANLQKVAEFIEQGKIQAAINQLSAFINKVEQDYSQGKLTQSERDSLVEAAENLIDDLN